MTKNIYVGNLSYSTTQDQLADVFSQFGEVISAKLVIDRDTNRSKGFGFVEMNEEDAVAAIAALNGANLDGRSLKVNEALERAPRPRRY